MERSCAQARRPYARVAAGCRTAGRVPGTVKGNISANAGTRYGVDLVSSPKRCQVAPKGRERHGSSVWNEEINRAITELAALCEFWLQ